MLSRFHKPLFVAIIGVLLAGVVPVASGLVGNQSQPVGNQSPPVGADVYLKQDGAWAAQAAFTATSYVSVTVCFGDGLHVTAALPGGAGARSDNNASYSYESCQRVTGTAPCSLSAGTKQLGPAEYSFDPLMGSASIHAYFGACRIDLVATATGVPRESGGVFQFVDPNGRVSLTAQADSSIARDVNALSGSVCGHTVPVAPKADTSGAIWRSVSGSAEANLRVG